MANYIDKIKDKLGNIIFPISLTKAIYKEGTSKTIDDLLNEKTNNLDLSTVAKSGDYKDIKGTPNNLPPSGAAGGCLSGNYPNPVVSKLGTARKINGVLFDGSADINVEDASKIPFEGVIQNTNPFGGRQLYLNTLDNVLAGANVKYFVVATLHKKNINGIIYPKPINPTDITLPQWEDSPVVSDVTNNADYLFNNNFENGITVPSDSYLKVALNFDQAGTAYFTGYPYGTYFLSYYYTSTPNSAQVRCYNGLAAHTIGYKTLNFADYCGTPNSSSYIQKCDDYGNYNRKNIEYIIFGNDKHSTVLTQIEWKLIRPDFGSNTPIFSNYGVNKSYRNFILGTNTDNKIVLNSSTGSIISGNIVSNGQSVVVDNDQRLKDARPASDVPPWAKKQEKPSYLFNDLTDVQVTAPTASQIIQWNGTAWVNSNPQSFSQVQADYNETDPSSVQFIKNKPSSLPADGGSATNASYLLESDTRNTNESPSWYMANRGCKNTYEFKYNSVIGLSLYGAPSYSEVSTFTSWADASGGLPVQLATNNAGMFFRTAINADTWAVWNKISSKDFKTQMEQPTDQKSGDIWIDLD